jgi:hypothetical protein
MKQHIKSLDELTVELEKYDIPAGIKFTAQMLWAVQMFLIDMKKENNRPLEEWSMAEIVRVARAGGGNVF